MPAPAPRPLSIDDDVLRAQSGDMDAFERLYRAHVGRVHALCVRLTAGQGTDELLQDVFVRVWERLPSFRGESAFSSWIHRVAVNVFLVARRGEDRRTQRVEYADDPDELARDPLLGHVRDDPDTRIDLERAIAHLPIGARAAFVLHDIEGYSHDEIAALQGVAAVTVRTQLHRARRLLMEELDR